MSSTQPLEDAVRRVVRGEDHWSALRSWGVDLSLGSDDVAVESATRHPVPVGPVDVATGLLRWAPEPELLHDWARVVHGASGLIELDFEDNPKYERLLDLLWRISFAESVTMAEIERAAQAVLGGGTGSPEVGDANRL